MEAPSRSVDLEAEAADIRDSARKKETKDTYCTRLVNLFFWFCDNCPASLEPAFKTLIDQKRAEDDEGRRRKSNPQTKAFLMQYF